MFYKKDIERLNLQVKRLWEDLKKEKERHVNCAGCRILGHKEDMYCKDYISWGTHLVTTYYHYGCYAEKFNVHLCPCGCGKWIPNKVKKCK